MEFSLSQVWTGKAWGSPSTMDRIASALERIADAMEMQATDEGLEPRAPMYLDD
jgi:hypothetical protein